MAVSGACSAVRVPSPRLWLRRVGIGQGYLVVGAVLHCLMWTLGKPGGPVAVHSFAAEEGRHGVVRPQPGGVNQDGSTTPSRGSGHSRPRTGLRIGPSHVGLVARQRI